MQLKPNVLKRENHGKFLISDMTKWPRSWIIKGVIFLIFEFSMKIIVEILSPELLLIDMSPYFTIGATHYRNPNSCLGVLREFSSAWKFIVTLIASLILLSAALYAHFVEVGPYYRRAMAFLVVGAVGNMADRLTVGAVIDYVDVSVGPEGSWMYLAWNFSDVAINIGAAFVVWSMIKKEHPFDDPPETPKTS